MSSTALPWKPRRALLSVSDKTGIVELAQFLADKEVELISTGGTAKLLKEHGINYRPIEDLTRRPEAFGGRMKSLSFELASGLLYRRGHAEDESQLESFGILPVDLIVCNLYPFTQNLSANLSLEEMVELIDVGGPTMIRASAKNFAHVATLVHPQDYESFCEQWQKSGEIDFTFRQYLAQKSFFLLSQYDETISVELARRFSLPAVPEIPGETSSLRYGENPQQKSWYSHFANYQSGSSAFLRKEFQGKELSYNNYLDMDQAHKCVSDLFQQLPKTWNHAVVVKHGNPCGVASHQNQLTALKEAYDCDSTSAFGGIVSVSNIFDGEMARWAITHFFEVIMAPSFTDEALEILSQKKNLRVISLPLKSAAGGEITVRSILGMKLWQQEDESFQNFAFKQVTKKSFHGTTEDLLRFGIIVTKYLKSNALGIFCEQNNTMTLAASGVGQPNRIDCLTRLAVPRAQERGINLNRCLLVSDAFFPFDDIVVAAHQWKIEHIVQPGGSLRDQEVIATCDRLGISMYFYGQRHFRH